MFFNNLSTSWLAGMGQQAESEKKLLEQWVYVRFNRLAGLWSFGKVTACFY